MVQGILLFERSSARFGMNFIHIFVSRRLLNSISMDEKRGD
jgi:hypothetical protein